MELLINQPNKYHVSFDIIKEFEQVILNDTLIKEVKQKNRVLGKCSLLIWKLWDRFQRRFITENRYNSSKSLEHNKQMFIILLGVDFGKCLPKYALPAIKNIYMFDAWPVNHEKILSFADFFKINNIFFSSSRVTEILQPRMHDTKCYWIPEGIKSEKYRYRPYINRDIDVLALGRKYDAYHELILPYLSADKRIYLYEKVKGKIVFPTSDEFIDGLSRSKISVCFPSNVTHPERSGNIETMTVRYLQSMASKCLVIGHAPQEMIDLFGYNPVLEIDMNDPIKQLQQIIKNYLQFVPLIEKNYENVIQNHTWSNRWNKIKDILADKS